MVRLCLALAAAMSCTPALAQTAPAPTAKPTRRQPQPWFLIAPLEETCLPPREVFDQADTPEAVAGQLSGDGSHYTVHYDRGTAARSDIATLKDERGTGGDVVLVRGKEACLLVLKKRAGG